MADEDTKTTTIPAPAVTKPRDYQTQVYQSLVELGASNPDALIIASGDYWKHCEKLSIAPQVTAALIYGAERHRHEVTRTTINEAREGLMAAEDCIGVHTHTPVVVAPPAAEAPKTAYRYADVSFDRLDDAQKFAALLEKAAPNIGSFVAGTKHGATVTTNAAPDVIAKTIKKHRWKGAVKMSEAAKMAAETRLSDTFSIIRHHEDASTKLAFVPAVVKDMMKLQGVTVAKAHTALLQMAHAGTIELRPEGGLGRLTDEEKKLAIKNDYDKHAPLTWIRVAVGAAEEMPRGPGGIQSQIAAKTECHTCIPWQKVARDPKIHADFVELAKKFGPIETPLDVYKVVGDDLSKETQEVFLVLALNIHSELMAPPYEVARGQRDRVAVGIDNVLDAASDARCAAYLVVHQHPGDTPTPSPADIKLTHDIRAATPPGRVFVDHVVIGVKTAYSITKKKLYKVK